MKPRYNFTPCERLVRGGHIALAFSYTCAIASLWWFEILLVKGNFGYSRTITVFLVVSVVFYGPILVYMLLGLPKCWRDAMNCIATDRIERGLCPVCAYDLRYTPRCPECAYELHAIEAE